MPVAHLYWQGLMAKHCTPTSSFLFLEVHSKKKKKLELSKEVGTRIYFFTAVTYEHQITFFTMSLSLWIRGSFLYWSYCSREAADVTQASHHPTSNATHLAPRFNCWNSRWLHQGIRWCTWALGCSFHSSCFGVRHRTPWLCWLTFSYDRNAAFHFAVVMQQNARSAFTYHVCNLLKSHIN